MDARGSRGTRAGAPALGQHLVPRSLAAELVRCAHIEPSDLVVEIGAGTGTITAALAARARAVIALELDRRFARQLRAAFASDPVVRIVEGDARSWPLPLEPFRAFGNVPFAITTDLLRHLVDDPLGAMVRADLVVQLEVARKRTQDPPRNVRSLVWGPPGGCSRSVAGCRRVASGHRRGSTPRFLRSVAASRRSLRPASSMHMNACCGACS